MADSYRSHTVPYTVDRLVSDLLNAIDHDCIAYYLQAIFSTIDKLQSSLFQKGSRHCVPSHVPNDPTHQYILNILSSPPSASFSSAPSNDVAIYSALHSKNLYHLIYASEQYFEQFRLLFSRAMNSQGAMDRRNTNALKELLYQALAYYILGYLIIIYYIPLILSQIETSKIQDPDLELYGQLISFYKNEFYFNQIRSDIEEYANAKRSKIVDNKSSDYYFPKIKRRKSAKSYMTDYGPEYYKNQDSQSDSEDDMANILGAHNLSNSQNIDLSPKPDANGQNSTPLNMTNTSLEDDLDEITVNVHEVGLSLKELPSINSRSLQKYLLAKKKNVLLFDLRSRESFNTNHITNKFLVNINPTLFYSNKDGLTDDGLERILKNILRKHFPSVQNVNAELDSVEDRDLITIKNAYNYFKQRHKFHLIVYYTDTETWNAFNNDKISFNFLQLFYDLIFKDKITNSKKAKKLPRPPKILSGNFESWLKLLEYQDIDHDSPTTLAQPDYENYYVAQPQEVFKNIAQKPVIYNGATDSNYSSNTNSKSNSTSSYGDNHYLQGSQNTLSYNTQHQESPKKSSFSPQKYSTTPTKVNFGNSKVSNNAKNGYNGTKNKIRDNPPADQPPPIPRKNSFLPNSHDLYNNPPKDLPPPVPEKIPIQPKVGISGNNRSNNINNNGNTEKTRYLATLTQASHHPLGQRGNSPIKPQFAHATPYETVNNNYVNVANGNSNPYANVGFNNNETVYAQYAQQPPPLPSAPPPPIPQSSVSQLPPYALHDIVGFPNVELDALIKKNIVSPYEAALEQNNKKHKAPPQVSPVPLTSPVPVPVPVPRAAPAVDAPVGLMNGYSNYQQQQQLQQQAQSQPLLASYVLPLSNAPPLVPASHQIIQSHMQAQAITVPQLQPPQQASQSRPVHHYHRDRKPSSQQQQQQQQHHHHHHVYPQQVSPQHYQQQYQRPYPAPVQLPEHSVPKRQFNALQVLSIVGLKNYGSNCYINSLLQCIFSITKFTEVFLNSGYRRYHADVSKKPIVSPAIGKLFDKMNTYGGVIIAPTNFLNSCSRIRPDFRIPYQQQDTAEFLIFLLDVLHEELTGSSAISHEYPELFIPALNSNDVTEFDTSSRLSINVTDEEIRNYNQWFKNLISKNGISPVSVFFQGQLESCLKCVKCLKVSKTFANFSVLTLPIVEKTITKKKIRLEDCIRLFTSDEILSGDNAWDCPSCKKKLEKLKEANNFYNSNYGDANDPASDISYPSGNSTSSNRNYGSTNANNHQKTFFNLRSKKKDKEKLSKDHNGSSSNGEPIAKEKCKSMEITGTKTIKSLKFIQLPRVLVINLSRFNFNKYGEQSSKDTTSIIFPITLDIKVKDQILTYRLFAFINHFGNLRSGHYTSIVNKQKNIGSYASGAGTGSGREDKKLKKDIWCYFDDENYKININPGINYGDNTITSSDVYVLFYQRVESVI